MSRRRRIPTLVFNRGFSNSVANSSPPPPNQHLPLLRSCKTLPHLRQIHAHLIIHGETHASHHIPLLLLNSYSSVHQTQAARSIFDSVPDPSPALYNSIIRAYARAGQHHAAIQLYQNMWEDQSRVVEPDKYTFTFVLKACGGAGDAKTGALVHEEVGRRGLEHDVFVRTALIDMYGKLGRLDNALELFDGMAEKDVVTWNAMIAGLAQGGKGEEAVRFFRRMQLVGMVPNSVTVLNLFPAVCASSEVSLCRAVHGSVEKRGLLRAVSNGLVDAYSKCGDVGGARLVFDSMMMSRDAVSWGTMISGYVFNGCYEEALELFDELRSMSVKVNSVSVVSAAVAATDLEDLERGMAVHDYARTTEVDGDIHVVTALITMYAKCDRIEKARQLFHGTHEKDMVAWSAMISALAQTGCSQGSLSLFLEMQEAGIRPNVVTLVSVLPACADLLDLRSGKSLHCYALKSSKELDQTVGTALVSMYVKCMCFRSANMLFDSHLQKNIVMWNALINGCAQVGDAINAMDVFQQLRLTGIRPDAGTMVGVLPACTLLNAIDHGMSIHGLIVKSGFEHDLHVKNATIDMYAKCGRPKTAEILFNESGCPKDIISWNTMIACFMHNGHADRAFSAFQHLKRGGLKPNLVTLVSMLPAASHLAALKEGMALHSHTIRTGFNSHLAIANSLIDMYSKCGKLDYAQEIFDQMAYRDSVSWNAMIIGYAIHGMGENAIVLFSRMKNAGIPMDTVSFVGVLSACRHGGLVEEGRKIFQAMSSEHYFEPKLEHYACMVDLYGRAGQLSEAWELIQSMPVQPDARVWGAFLDACSKHSNVRMGTVALENLKMLEYGNAAPYVLLSGIYAQHGRWMEARKIRKTMRHAGLSKMPGCSWLDVKDAMPAL